MAIILIFTILSFLSSSGANGFGFSTDLIHRDSPSSPFYDPSLTPYEHLANSLRRSHERSNHFASVFRNELSPSSEIIPNGGAYLMKIALGTPPFTIFAIADTGSHLIWTQCTPCFYCYKQKAPLFNPRKSSTYKLPPCDSASCLSIPRHDCTLNGTCEYSVFYGDGSYSKGTLASETLTLGSENNQPVSLPGITFGCGFENGGRFNANGSGMVGLGGGFNSLVTQLKSSIQGMFSYCLAPGFSKIKTPSQINFGTNGLVSGSGVVSTPIDLRSGFYFLTLEALSVGKDRVNLTHSSAPTSNRTRGNIIIDSGTTLTYLPPSGFTTFVSLVKKSMGNNTVPGPLKILPLCYRLIDKPSFPIIQAHFTGASIELKPINTFIEINRFITCLAFVPGPMPIYGNIAQTNFLVGYDTIKRSVSFKPSNCGYESH